MIFRAFVDDATWRVTLDKAAFTGRTLASVGLALFLAFFFQLQSPASAVTTVMIVANPVVGALVSKSVWRVIGTGLGACLAVGLMAAFPQAPILYFFALALVIGVACVVATFLRLSRAYASVLTGYTIMMITMPSFYDPGGIFISALSRLSAVATGIVVTAAVFMVTTFRRPERLLQQLGAMFRATADHALNFYQTQGRDVGTESAADASPLPTFRNWPQPLYAERDRLLGQLAGLSVSVENAATDNPEIANRLRAFLTGLSGLSGIVAIFHPHWASHPDDAVVAEDVHERMAATLRDVAALSQHPDWLADGTAVRARLHAAIAEFDVLELSRPDVVALIALDNARDVLVQFDHVAEMLSMGEGTSAVYARLQTYREWLPALRNGFRSAIITFLAGLIWYVTRWNTGPMFMLIIVAVVSLLSTTPSAARASPYLAVGLVLSVPAVLLCHLYFLPLIDGFPLLWLTMCLFLLPGVWLQFSPKFGPIAFGYVVFFTILLSVNNPIRYNDIVLLNNWMAVVVAAALLVVVFKVVIPANDRSDAASLISSLVNGVQRLAFETRNQGTIWVRWESLQLQKISRMRMRLAMASPPVKLPEYMDAAYATLSVGRMIVRIRQMLAASPLGGELSRSVGMALASFRGVRSHPEHTAECLRNAADKLLADGQDSLDCARIAACLIQIAHVLDEAPGFFHKHGPIQLSPRMKQADRPLSAPVPVLSTILGIEKTA